MAEDHTAIRGVDQRRSSPKPGSVRLTAELRGRYYLENWADGRERVVSCFACRTQYLTPDTLSVSAPVSGRVGDKVVTHFDEFGVLRGTIARRLGFGFVLTLTLSEQRRAALARKIGWFERQKYFEVLDQRRHRRVVPRNPRSTLTLASGRRLRCFVIDMSISGAAVSADLMPEIGTPMAVGRLVGRVVRHLDPGFAIQFVDVQTFETLDRLLFERPSQRVYL